MKKYIPMILMVLMGMVIGGTLSYLGMDRGLDVESLVIGIVCLILFYILHIFLHEAGHLLFGKLTGYSFLSFRVFSYMIVATENGLQFKKFHVPGTLGQCLMSPPPYEKDNYPFKLYLLGGALLNILASILVAVVSWIFGEFSYLAILFILLGLFIGYTNIIPYSFNDGMSLKMAWNNEKMQKLLYAQFYINAETTKGVSFLDLPEDLFEIPVSEEDTDYFSVWFICMKMVRAMQQQDFLEAKRINDSLWRVKDKLIPMYKLEISRERLFLLSLLEEHPEEANKLYKDKQLKRYMSLKQMANKRILAAYELYIQKNPQKALKLCKEGLNLEKQNPNAADARLERKLIEGLTRSALTL